jgi:hypothetical protein
MIPQVVTYWKYYLYFDAGAVGGQGKAGISEVGMNDGAAAVQARTG